jgi:hypothetical protein
MATWRLGNTPIALPLAPIASLLLGHPVPTIKELSQREQNIGAAKEIRARKDFFSDLRDHYMTK